MTDPSSARVAAEKLVRLGVETPIVTLGELGVYYLTQGGGQYIPALTVQAVDTVAAGQVQRHLPCAVQVVLEAPGQLRNERL